MSKRTELDSSDLEWLNMEFLPWIEIWPLLHERAHGEPEAVGEGEVVLADVSRVHARVRGRPLVRRKSV